MRQVQPEMLPKNSNISSVYKISSLKTTLPKTLQLKTLDFLQQTITMYFFFFLVALVTLFATHVLFILEIV
jgi:hypothetical protein